MIADLVYAYCIRNFHRFNTPFIQSLWKRYVVPNAQKNTVIKIHERRMVVSIGYMYPIFARKFDTYNNPLLELVYQTYLAKKRKVNIIDIGAAIGDTIAFIEANIPNVLDKAYCIDGDDHFFDLLKKNYGSRENIILIKELLTDKISSSESRLERTHLGTASSIGSEKVNASSLDDVFSKYKGGVDVIKIDVDGFDGKVLAGGLDLIRDTKPSIIFEWHPILCNLTGNNHSLHFSTLLEAGYSKFLFYTKFGKFSHFDNLNNMSNISLLAELCLRNKFEYDWHYDVIALHNTSDLEVLPLAEQEFSRNVKSRF